MAMTPSQHGMQAPTSLRDWATFGCSIGARTRQRAKVIVKLRPIVKNKNEKTKTIRDASIYVFAMCVCDVLLFGEFLFGGRSALISSRVPDLSLKVPRVKVVTAQVIFWLFVL